MDVLSIIRREHRAVEAMFDEIQDCKPGDARIVALARQIQRELSTHLAIEERLFYNRIRKSVEEDDECVDILEAYAEHEGAKHILVLLGSGRKNDAKLKAELQVLGESVKHHVKEEESKVFALAKEYIGGEELAEIGEAWADAKRKASSSNGASHKTTSGKKTRRVTRRS